MRALIAAALLLAAFPANAQTLRDAASGLAITAPPGFIATVSPLSDPPDYLVFDVRAPGDTDTSCRITSQTGNSARTQTEINANASTAAYRDIVAFVIGTFYEIHTLEPITHGGVTGLAAIGDPRPLEGMPARAQEVRSLLIILETPRRRITLACVSEKSDFRERLPQFEAVLRGITIP